MVMPFSFLSATERPNLAIPHGGIVENQTNAAGVKRRAGGYWVGIAPGESGASVAEPDGFRGINFRSGDKESSHLRTG